MRLFTLALFALVALVQYPLWLGKGGWLRVWELDRQLAMQNQSNARLQERNRALEAEVRDLRQGTGAIEERARYELGMIRPDEIFVQVAEPGTSGVPAVASGPPTALSAAPANPARAIR
ncbi:MAG TPA: cell division protein FtsB [Burkholderiaceae bacterium]|nr:cell division protein FtsB [Burkholderiaceae bacterium]